MTHTALLIGAAGGILKEVAASLADERHTLILFDKDAASVAALALTLSERTNVKVIIGDITDTLAVEAQLAELLEDYQPDILVNGVGGDTRVIGYDQLTPGHFEAAYQENVVGTFTAIKAIAPSMARTGYGRIVNFASAGGRTYSHFNNAGYVAAKAAVIGMTKQVAYELASSGVCVNVVAHGPIATERVAGAWERREESEKEAVLSKLPMRRMGTVSEAVGSVLYLCSESAGFTTGTTIDVNGGLYM